MLTEMAKDNRWPVTFSIGMVTFAPPPGNIEDMLRAADDLMYTVKHNGKNSVATSFNESLNAAAFAAPATAQARLRTS